MLFLVTLWEALLASPAPALLCAPEATGLVLVTGRASPLPLSHPSAGAWGGGGCWVSPSAVTLGLMEVLPDGCVQVGKKELMYAGTVGLITYLGGVIFINRKKTSSAKMVMAEVAKTMIAENVSGVVALPGGVMWQCWWEGMLQEGCWSRALSPAGEGVGVP